MQQAGLYKHITLDHPDMVGFSKHMSQRGKKHNSFKQVISKVAEWIHFVNTEAAVPEDKVNEIHWEALMKKEYTQAYFDKLLFKGRVSVGTCRKRGNAIRTFCNYLDWHYSGPENNIQTTASKVIRTIVTHMTAIYQHQERATVRSLKFQTQLEMHKGNKCMVFTMEDLL